MNEPTHRQSTANGDVLPLHARTVLPESQYLRILQGGLVVRDHPDWSVTLKDQRAGVQLPKGTVLLQGEDGSLLLTEDTCVLADIKVTGPYQLSFGFDGFGAVLPAGSLLTALGVTARELLDTNLWIYQPDVPEQKNLAA